MRRRSTVGGALEMFSLPLPLPYSFSPRYVYSIALLYVTDFCNRSHWGDTAGKPTPTRALRSHMQVFLVFDIYVQFANVLTECYYIGCVLGLMSRDEDIFKTASAVYGLSSSIIRPLTAHNKIHTIHILKTHRNRDKKVFTSVFVTFISSMEQTCRDLSRTSYRGGGGKGG